MIFFGTPGPGTTNQSNFIFINWHDMPNAHRPLEPAYALLQKSAASASLPLYNLCYTAVYDATMLSWLKNDLIKSDVIFLTAQSIYMWIRKTAIRVHWLSKRPRFSRTLMKSKIVQIWYICSRQFHDGKKGAHEVVFNTKHFSWHSFSLPGICVFKSETSGW